jgi:glycosyltransferase involved in cell wall biosynthesis
MPAISVVIASKVGAPFLDRCVESVRAEASKLGAEVIVVVAGSEAYAAGVASRHPWTRVVHPADVVTIPALRQRGVEDAAGDFVAVIEEHCAADGDWLTRALEAHARGNYAAVGGALTDSDYDRIADWVVYFVEYHGALPPPPDGETAELNDANIVYRRAALVAHRDLLAGGYWPMTLHPTLAAEGKRFLSVPAMVVRHCGPFPFGYYLRQRYLFSRAFAGVRAQNQGMAKRLAYVVAAPIMPLVLFARIARTVAAKRCRVGRFVTAAFAIAVALVVLAAGEWVGCVLGPGDALEKVE